MRIALLLGFTPLLFWAGDAVAQGSDGLTIPYSVTGTHALGDGVNILSPAAQVAECVSYSTPQPDTAGAYQSRSEMSVLSTFDSLRRETQLDLGYQTTGKISAGVFSANSSFKATGKFGDVSDRESKSLVVMFTANADHGRDVLVNYDLKPEYKTLLATNPDEFRRRCGTHFIRAVHKISDVSIFVTFSGLSESGKNSLETSLEQTVGGGVQINKISGEGSTTLTANYKRIVDFAKRSSRVSVKVFAHGGTGTGVILPTGTDPSDLGAIASALSTYSSGFTAANAAPWEYIVLPYTVFGAPPTPFNPELLTKIGKLTEQLLRVNDALKTVAGYRPAMGASFDRYFAPMQGKLQALRDNLMATINACASGGQCEGGDSDLLSDYVFLGDVFSKAATEASCSFQKSSALLQRRDLASNPRILESITINLAATAPFYDVLDFASLKLSRLGRDFQLEDVTPGFSGFALSRTPAGAPKRLFGSIYFRNLRSRETLSVEAGTKNVIVDQAALSDRREEVLGSMYLVEVGGPGGLRYGFNLGFPDRSACKALTAN